MKIQSISVVVPTKGCVNNCKMCVSSMHESPYENKFDEIAYRKRIKYAANNGVNTLILTGTGEALQNIRFLKKFKEVLAKEDHPFPNVELQTTGVLLTDHKITHWGEPFNYDVVDYKNISLLKELGVNTISLSVSDIFDSKSNWDIIGAPEKLQIDLNHLCEFIREKEFNLRLSLNMTKAYNKIKPVDLYHRCRDLGAHQITLRKLYHSDDESKQTKWVKKNGMGNAHFLAFEEYIAGGNDGLMHVPGLGAPLYRLPFGAMVYSYEGMSIAIDDNCMSKNNNDNLKYVILRENGKLYCQWDDNGSLLF